MAIGGGQAADTISAFRTGVAGQAGITLLSLAYGGNAAVWAAAYLLGPGFALGTGSAIRLTEVTVGPLPTLPVLAGLPNGPMGVAGIALLTVPVLAGLAAGWLFAVRAARGREAAGSGLGSRPRRTARVAARGGDRAARAARVAGALSLASAGRARRPGGRRRAGPALPGLRRIAGRWPARHHRCRPVAGGLGHHGSGRCLGGGRRGSRPCLRAGPQGTDGPARTRDHWRCCSGRWSTASRGRCANDDQHTMPSTTPTAEQIRPVIAWLRLLARPEFAFFKPSQLKTRPTMPTTMPI